MDSQALLQCTERFHDRIEIESSDGQTQAVHQGPREWRQAPGACLVIIYAKGLAAGWQSL